MGTWIYSCVSRIFLFNHSLLVFGIFALLSVAIQIYICASWPVWWSGGGFGSRPMVDYVPVLAISYAARSRQLYAGT